MTGFCLLHKGIEGSTTVRPLFSVFWTGCDEQLEAIQIIYRKTDAMEKGTKGWGLLLSYNLKTDMTTAFSKASTESYILDSVNTTKAAAEQIAHPMIFPLIIFSGLFSLANAVRVEIWQRAARERLRRIEQAVTHDRTAAGPQDSYIDEYGLINFNQIIMELATCHTEVLKKSPSAYLRVLDGFDDAMSLFEMHAQRPSPGPHVH